MCSMLNGSWAGLCVGTLVTSSTSSCVLSFLSPPLLYWQALDRHMLLATGKGTNSTNQLTPIHLGSAARRIETTRLEAQTLG